MYMSNNVTQEGNLKFIGTAMSCDELYIPPTTLHTDLVNLMKHAGI